VREYLGVHFNMIMMQTLCGLSGVGCAEGQISLSEQVKHSAENPRHLPREGGEEEGGLGGESGGQSLISHLISFFHTYFCPIFSLNVPMVDLCNEFELSYLSHLYTDSAPCGRYV